MPHIDIRDKTLEHIPTPTLTTSQLQKQIVLFSLHIFFTQPNYVTKGTFQFVRYHNCLTSSTPLVSLLTVNLPSFSVLMIMIIVGAQSHLRSWSLIAQNNRLVFFVSFFSSYNQQSWKSIHHLCRHTLYRISLKVIRVFRQQQIQSKGLVLIFKRFQHRVQPALTHNFSIES